MCVVTNSSFFYHHGSCKIPRPFLFFAFLFCLLGTGASVSAGISTGVCSNCHTMHNSQDGASMALIGGSANPSPFLTRGSCTGCHAMGTGSKIVIVGDTEIPQVMHTDGTGDLAGGNFAYMLGTKGSGAADSKGHNVVDFPAEEDDDLIGPPGGSVIHDLTGVVNDTNLTCAGNHGCHGYRNSTVGSGINALRGAHHANVDGKCDIADTPANSYRFLYGVRGLENQNPAGKWQNVSAGNHNEYFGQTMPKQLSCGDTTTRCHSAAGISPPNHTMSEFCATCHGNFHTLTVGTSEGIGTGIKPFIRHPTDMALPNSGEYAAYNGDNSYSVEAPVARSGAVPDAVSAAVNPATGTDVVMCLSCHYAHGSDYADMLRWDYSTIVANGGANDAGCFVCHTTKDD